MISQLLVWVLCTAIQQSESEEVLDAEQVAYGAVFWSFRKEKVCPIRLGFLPFSQPQP